VILRAGTGDEASEVALQELERQFESAGDNLAPVRPWDDEPLVACYEKMLKDRGIDWRTRLQVRDTAADVR